MYYTIIALTKPATVLYMYTTWMKAKNINNLESRERWLIYSGSNHLAGLRASTLLWQPILYKLYLQKLSPSNTHAAGTVTSISFHWHATGNNLSQYASIVPLIACSTTATGITNSMSKNNKEKAIMVQ